jgi:polyisoprenyl-phosphate glycosyltransferase
MQQAVNNLPIKSKADSSESPEISVVIPVYNAAACLHSLYARLKATLDRINESFEIVFVDDRCPYGSWAVLMEIAKDNPRIKLIRLSKNCGQQIAISAGLNETVGRWVVVMDCDLEDPPEDLSRLYQAANDGYDIVFARRLRKKNSLIGSLSTKAYFGLLSVFANGRFNGEYGNFSIISKRVVDAYKEINEQDRHYLLLLQWLGFNSTELEYEPGMRLDGLGSSFRIGALLTLLFQGMAYHTTFMLETVIKIGITTALAGFVYAGWLGYNFWQSRAISECSVLTLAVLLIGGIMLISQGVNGLYIGRIFEKSKGRPPFIVDRRVIGGLEP